MPYWDSNPWPLASQQDTLTTELYELYTILLKMDLPIIIIEYFENSRKRRYFPLCPRL
jgi:hypothetical protein